MSEPPQYGAVGRERRSSTRRPIHVDAKLEYKSASGMACAIADFCPEGVFVTYPAGTADRLQTLRLNHEHVVGLSFTDQQTNRDHQLSIIVKRFAPSAFGGMFETSNTAAITALLRMCGSGSMEEGLVSAQPESASLLLRQIERTIKACVEPLLDGFLASLPAAFDEAIDKALNDKQKTEYTDSVIEISKLGGSLKDRYFQNLCDGLVPRSGNDEEAEAPALLMDENLSLVDKDEFEDWLTLKVMVTKAEAAYQEELLKLKLRLDSVDIKSVKGYANPVGPALVCYALRDTLVSTRLSALAERLSLKVFETEVVRQLEAMYVELNQLMIRQGILPDLNLTKYHGSQGQAATQQAAEDGTDVASDAESETSEDEECQPQQSPDPATPSDPPLNPAAAQSGMPATAANPQPQINPASNQAAGALAQTSPFSNVGQYLNSARESVVAVNNLLSSLRQQRQQAGVPDSNDGLFPTPDVAPPYQNEEVLDSLARLQSMPQADKSIEQTAGLRERMAVWVGENEGESKSFTPEQDKTLDVVDRFFASLLKNRKLTDISKSQIRGMEVPMVRLLLRNPDFFKDSAHPARKLIDRLAQVGVKGARNSPSQVARINKLVGKIQQEHVEDPRVFDEALAEVDEILERQNLLYRRNVERVMAAAEGQQKLEESKRAVSRAIRERVGNRKVPKAVATLLSGGWRDLLGLTWLRQGPASQAWNDYLNVIEMLVKIGSEPDYKVNIPELLKVIQDGLATISSNHIPSGLVRDQIKDLLVSTTKAGSPELVEIPDGHEQQQKADISLLKEARERGLQRWLQRAQKLKIGEWLKISRDNKEPELIRLVWVGKNHTRYVFVNHQGMKIIDLDALTLAAYLQKGIAVSEPEFDKPVVDESLENMVKDLYEQLSHAGTHDELTQLMLRKEFERQLLVLQSTLAADEPVVCLLLSLGQFRLINDSAGTEAGDAVLKELTSLLTRELPENALLGRYSGDEFIVCFAGSIEPLLGTIRTAIDNYRIEWDGNKFRVSAAIGYVETTTGNLDARQWIQAAEDACREAKKAGSGKTQAYQLDKTRMEQRESIALKVANLNESLDEERLLLRCQKIVPLKKATKLGVHYEILLSIYDKGGRLIPATDFIRAAEDYKRIQDVDRWVVGQTLDWMTKNRSNINKINGISMNLSGHSFNDDALLEYIFKRLTEDDFPLQKLTFELTEAAAISRPYEVAEFISELGEYGCRFCLGQYGTGMVSYDLLRKLPVDLIKVDGSFIKDVASDKNDLMMVRSMIEMAHYLKREVAVPRVESREAFSTLKVMGADYAQGYLIEKPKSLANLWASTV